jgi:hypothetical protein
MITGHLSAANVLNERRYGINKRVKRFLTISPGPVSPRRDATR